MIQVKTIQEFIMKCDKCNTTLYKPCCGVYFMSENDLIKEAIEQGWKLSGNYSLCPDCK